MRVAPIQDICAAHGIDKDTWNRLRADEGFQATLLSYVQMLKEEGTSFKLKARLQSEELLKTSWEIIHGVDTPANVKADLIKHTHRVAGLDASIEQKAKAMGTAGNANNFQININLGDT